MYIIYIYIIRIQLGRTALFTVYFSISYEDIDDRNASGINIEPTNDSTTSAEAIKTAPSQDNYTKLLDARSFGEWRRSTKGILL